MTRDELEQVLAEKGYAETKIKQNGAGYWVKDDEHVVCVTNVNVGFYWDGDIPDAIIPLQRLSCKDGVITLHKEFEL